jgi:hypothetical protein
MKFTGGCVLVYNDYHCEGKFGLMEKSIAVLVQSYNEDSYTKIKKGRKELVIFAGVLG